MNGCPFIKGNWFFTDANYLFQNKQCIILISFVFSTNDNNKNPIYVVI